MTDSSPLGATSWLSPATEETFIVVLSRRGFVYGSGAAAVMAAFGPSFLQAASAAPSLTGKDLELLRTRWVESLTGAQSIRNSPSTFTAAIAAMDSGVNGRLERVSPTATRFFDNRDWAIGATDTNKTNNMRMNYVDLQVLATAWATPGSIHEGSVAVLDVLKQGLAHMDTMIYNTTTKWWGNWWSWNIGASRPLADMMAILHAELDQVTIDKHCAAIDHFLPNRDPSLQLSTGGPQVSDGANRVDICRAIIVRSIVQPDTALLSDAVAALSPTWQYVTEGNGFFRDGSFVQHSTIGYTGTYGLVLLGGLARLFGLLAGTAFDITDQTRSNLLGVIEGSFAPLTYNGQMMDSVRGRAVSRIGERSRDNGDQLIEDTLRLAGAADGATAERWRGLCKQWIQSNEGQTITQTKNITRLALVTDLVSSTVEPVPDATGPHMFPAMDRLVHRSPDNDWAVCVAMCSNRIAWSEGSPEENFNGVKTSQGMTYVYLAGDDDHFDDEYWATSDLEAPVGTTVDLTPLGKNPEGTWGGRTPQNEWTGGAQLAGMAVAGMHLVAPGRTGLVARKTWFTLQDMIVALGADISTASEAEVRTVVEHRNLGTEPRRLVVDGSAVTAEAKLTNPTWAHVDNVGGYLFLDDSAEIVAGMTELSGAWRRNNTNTGAGTDVVHTRQYATLSYHHGVGSEVAGATYAYALLPNASETETISRAAAPGVTILTNDGTTQGITLPDGTTAATFWKPGTTGDFTSDASLCLVARRGKNSVEVAISDPTQAADVVRVTVAGIETKSIEGAGATRVTFEQKGDDTLLVIDTSTSAGLTVTFTLRGQADEPAPSASPSASETPSATPSSTPSTEPSETPSATTSPTPTPTTSTSPTRTPSSTTAPTTRPTTIRPTSSKPSKRPGLPNTGA